MKSRQLDKEKIAMHKAESGGALQLSVRLTEWNNALGCAARIQNANLGRTKAGSGP
jgi:hypothetical protein